MFVAAASGPALGAAAALVANVGEVAFVVGLVATARRFAPRALAPGPEGAARDPAASEPATARRR